MQLRTQLRNGSTAKRPEFPLIRQIHSNAHRRKWESMRQSRGTGRSVPLPKFPDTSTGRKVSALALYVKAVFRKQGSERNSGINT